MRRTKYTRRTVLLHHAKSRRVKLRPSIQYTDQVDEVVANSRGPRTAGRGAKYRGLPVRGPKSNSRGPRTFF